MAKRKQTQAEKIASIPIENITKMSLSERKQLEKYIQTLRSGYKRRVQSFSRKGLISHAQIALEGTIPNKRPVQLTKMTRNQLILEFARYSKFFNDVTSTEEGIKKVNREQDIRIFGSDSRGKPKRTMTDLERQKFWNLFEEYQNQNPTANSRYGSESIQQYIADALFENHGLDEENLVDFLTRVEQRLEQKSIDENLRSVPNVYSGRGTTFSE